MRFLRTLTNALLAGALGAAYLTILLLQLNPEVPLASGTVWRWFGAFGVFYGLPLALAFYLAVLIRELVSGYMLSPGWISVRLLAWLSAIATAVASALMWLNLRGLPTLFTDAAARRFAFGAGATTASAVVLLAIAIAHYSFGRRGSRVGAALLAIALAASLALPLAARGRGGPLPLGSRRLTLTPPPVREAPRITLLALDGATLDYIWPRVAEGRLPNFARLLDGGATMGLATIRPTQPDPVWAAVATGMYPAKNGVRSDAEYFARGDARRLDVLPDHCFSHLLVRAGIVGDEPLTSAAWRARPLWSILGDYGIRAGVVRWPLTYPAQPIAGFVLSDRYHLLPGDPRVVFPIDTLPRVREAFAGVPDQYWDADYSRARQTLTDQRDVSFTALRYQGLDAVEHLYFRYSDARSIGDVGDGRRQRYGALLDRTYDFIDGQIGAALDGQSRGDLLLVVSGFGMEAVAPLERLADSLLGDAGVSGTHEHAPDGFLLAYGSEVAAGRRSRGSIVDVTPTVLYYAGVPMGRDMDGFTRADLFSAAFTASRPIASIPSHGR